jgi:hypothetical protein
LSKNHDAKKLTAVKRFDIIVTAMAVDTVLKTFPRDEFHELRKNHSSCVHTGFRQKKTPKKGQTVSNRIPKIMNITSIIAIGYRKIWQFSLDASGVDFEIGGEKRESFGRKNIEERANVSSS